MALPLHCRLISGIDGIQEEAGRVRVRALILSRREKLVAFGMGMIPRLAGANGAFHDCMCKDVFKLVGEAYGDY